MPPSLFHPRCSVLPLFRHPGLVPGSTVPATQRSITNRIISRWVDPGTSLGDGKWEAVGAATGWYQAPRDVSPRQGKERPLTSA
jgi:hypothetical protein